MLARRAAHCAPPAPTPADGDPTPHLCRGAPHRATAERAHSGRWEPASWHLDGGGIPGCPGSQSRKPTPQTGRVNRGQGADACPASARRAAHCASPTPTPADGDSTLHLCRGAPHRATAERAHSGWEPASRHLDVQRIWRFTRRFTLAAAVQVPNCPFKLLFELGLIFSLLGRGHRPGPHQHGQPQRGYVSPH